MPYQAEISRKNPGCFLFLIDQSESMEDPFGGGEDGRRKAEELATILNKLIHNLCIRCAKSDAIYDYFHAGVLGYSEESCKPALGGELSGRSLVPIGDLASKPLRIEERIKKSDDGAGGVLDQTVKFPVWFDPYWKGGTPMCAALKEATRTLDRITDQRQQTPGSTCQTALSSLIDAHPVHGCTRERAGYAGRGKLARI